MGKRAGSSSAPVSHVLFNMIRFAKNIRLAVFGGLVAGLLAQSAPAALPSVLPATLPLYFEAGTGPGPAQFSARGNNYQFMVSANGVQMALRNTAESAAVRMQFAGASARAQVRGDAELPGRINYLIGNDRAQWRAGVTTFGKVRVEELYPGINLVCYGNQRQLEYDFALAPGADPGAIAMRFDGADKLSISPEGELIVGLAGGEIRQRKPVIYQTIGGGRKEIAGGYRLADARTVTFDVSQYDHRQPLVIDPVLGFSTYFGGTAGDTAWAVAVQTSGTNNTIYLAGQTFSQQFYTNGPPFSTVGAFQPNYAGGNFTGDAFVAKLELEGLTTNLEYLTYLGGSVDDGAQSLAVDADGDAFVTGFTDSPDFPTVNPLYPHISGTNAGFGSYPVDAFVAELSPDGSSLIYSTYLGGSGMDSGQGIVVDSAGAAYVTGITYSSNFPAISAITYSSNSTSYALPNRLACTNTVYFNANAFLAKIGPGGWPLVYSTYFGGNNFDEGMSIALDSSNNVYVTGFTSSTNFPANRAIYQTLVRTNLVGTNHVLVSITNLYNGFLLNGATNQSSASDAFVAEFDSTGTNLVYSTLLGGTNNEIATHIAVDNTGDAYVTGWSVSSNYPSTFSPYLPITSFVATNTSLGWLATNAFLTKIGLASGNFVITNRNHIFTNTTEAVIEWSALFGGQGVDVGNCVAVDTNHGVVVATGSASSTNFPVYNPPGNLATTTNSGLSDAFVIAFDTAGTSPLYSAYLGGNANDYGYGVAVDTNGNVFIVGQTLSTNFPTLNGPIAALTGTNDAFVSIFLQTPFAPEIIGQAGTNWNVYVGRTLGMSVTASGSPVLTYQWQESVTNLDGTNLIVTWTNVMDSSNNISGSTNSLLVFSFPQVTNSGFYQVVVTNFAGAVTSSVPYYLNVTNIPPSISVPPTNQTAGLGSVATFAVTASGTFPLSYQWLKDGTNLMNGTNAFAGGIFSGVTNDTLTISNLLLSDYGNYSVIVTNAGGSVTSSPALLTVQISPLIVTPPQPTNESLAVGGLAYFVVTAAGKVPLHYQWQVNGTNVANVNGFIGGANTNLFYIFNAQTTNNGNYTVIVTNTAGSVTSAPAILRVTNIPPAITLQPANQTVGAKSTATFAVSATGTAPLSYRWQVNGTNLVNANGRISGATNATLTISNVQTNDMATNYLVIVTNFGGSVTSSVAALTVVTAPEILVQPQPTNQSMAVGSTATITVSALGTVPLSYQWRRSGTNLVNGGRISGATTNVLTISNTLTNDTATNYLVIITNIAGSVTSSNASLTVTNIPAAIILQPTNQAVPVSSNVSFVVSAIGTAPLGYRWQMNGTNLVNGGSVSGVTTTNLTINNAQTNNSGSYAVIVTNIAGVVTSSVVTLSVTVAPEIIVQPVDQSLAVDATATLTVTAVGKLPLSYRWQKSGTNLLNGHGITGATTPTLTITKAQTNNSGIYSVVITNVAGSVTSSNALLTVTNVPVTITAQPQSQAVPVGTNVTLAVTATGTLPLSYQWQANGTDLVDGGRISGSTTSQLVITNAQTSDSATNYLVIVSNVLGAVTSSIAIVTVTNIPPAIIAQPTNQMVGAGATATFAVTATGTAPLVYQWQVNGTNLVDGTNLVTGEIFTGSISNVLVISNVQTNDAATNYLVIVTNIAGVVTSSVVTLTVIVAPEIIVQPTNQAVVAGSPVTLAVTAVGMVPLSYQWQVNGTNLVDAGNISGSATGTLTITNAQTTNSGTYSVTVTNLAGSVTSSNAVLTVALAPVILVQPVNQSMAVGDTATFAVNAVGELPLSYQWRVNGTNLVDGTNLITGGVFSGSTASTLTITNAQTTNSGLYSVVITNVAGSMTSSNALLTVTNVPVAIITQPPNWTVYVGRLFALNVVATGTAPLSYQWQKNGTNVVDEGDITGSTNSLLIFSFPTTTDSGNYRVIVTNITGAVTSSVAVVTVTNIPPAITLQPTNQMVGAGTTATFAVTASGTAPLGYQWQVNGTNLVDGTNLFTGEIFSGSNTNVLAISNVQTNDEGNYSVIVMNAGGSVTSSNALLTVVVSPLITVQPTNQTVGLGSPATLAVTAIGMMPLSYQWQLDGTNLTDGGGLIGSTTDTLTINSAQLTNSGTYTVIVTNQAGSVTSSNAVLTVTALPVILVQPTNQSFGVADTATLAVVAVGLEPLGYQWQVNGTNLVDGTNALAGGVFSGSATNVLIISNVQTNDTGSYTVIVTNLAGSVTSSNADLTVTNVATVLSLQPTNQTVGVGSTVTFSVNGNAQNPLSLQWLKDATPLVDGGRISGSTGAQLTISDAQTNDDGTYWLVVSNAWGTLASSNAILTVLSAPAFTRFTPAGGGSFVLSGVGGTNSGTYYVLTSSNLVLLLTNWTLTATGQFDSQGNFIFTNLASTNAPQLFYILQMPP